MTRLRTFAAFVVVGITTGLIWTGVAARGPWSLRGRDGARHGCNRRHRRRMDRRLRARTRSPSTPRSSESCHDLIGPGRDVIIVEISGPTVDAGGGVWAGMSGSPVYIDHGGGPELAGALAYGFSFGATNIAGLTPAEDMLHVNGLAACARARVPARIKLPRSVVRKVAAKIGAALPTVGGSLVRLKLPVSISGVAPERYAADAEAALLQEVQADDEVHARAASALRQPLRSRGRPRPGRELRRRPLLRRPHLGGRRDDHVRLRRPGARLRTPDALLRQDVARRRLGRRDRDRPRRARPLQARQRHEPGRHARPGPPRGHPRGGRRAPVDPDHDRRSRRSTATTRTSATTDVVFKEAFPDLAFSHIFSSIDSVFDKIGDGSASYNWTIEGKREDGSPWELHKTNMYVSRVRPLVRVGVRDLRRAARDRELSEREDRVHEPRGDDQPRGDRPRLRAREAPLVPRWVVRHGQIAFAPIPGRHAQVPGDPEAVGRLGEPEGQLPADDSAERPRRRGGDRRRRLGLQSRSSARLRPTHPTRSTTCSRASRASRTTCSSPSSSRAARQGQRRSGHGA